LAEVRSDGDYRCRSGRQPAAGLCRRDRWNLAECRQLFRTTGV